MQESIDDFKQTHGSTRSSLLVAAWNCACVDLCVSQMNQSLQDLGLIEQHFHQEPSVCAFLEICYYIPAILLMSLMFLCNFYCKERFREAEIWPVYWNEECMYTFKYYRKLNFSKISTRVRLIFGVNSLFTEVSKALPCERNFIGTYLGFQRIFTPETFVLFLGNSSILVFISL